jgi:DNA anti-recombination protein RmuC
MSDFEVNKAKGETKQSNAQLEKALNHFKDAVDSGAESVGQKREKINSLVDNKKQAAQDFLENTFEGAESFVDRQSGLLHKALNNTRSETEHFLKDVQSSIDAFSQDVQSSVSKMLGGMEDRRITTFATLFFAGALLGTFFGRRYMARSASSDRDVIQEQNVGKADINPNVTGEMRKIA